MRIVKRPPRKIIVKATEDASDEVERSQAKQITEHPHFPLIMACLRKGVPNADIAEFFYLEGLIGVRQKTFKQYLDTYKRRHAEAILKMDKEKAFEEHDFDGLIQAHFPDMDVENELQKLLRFQKMRLAIGHQTENSLKMINPDIYKDVKVTVDILEKLAEARGGGGAKAKKGQTEVTADAEESLRQINEAEGAQDKLSHLAGSLMNALSKRNKAVQTDGNA